MPGDLESEFSGFIIGKPLADRSSKSLIGKGWPDGADLKRPKKKRRPGGKIKSNAASGFLYLFNATRCTYCFRALDNDEVTVDHIIPQSKGGSGWAFNQAICCEECNVKKSDRLLSVTELRRFFGEARTLALLDEMKRCKIEGS